MSPFVQSLRLRTLPLSVSGIILGTGLAYQSAFSFQLSVFILAICTTLCLQILSNLANELGDALKGTDADQQGRAAYGLQSGKITLRQMYTMIGIFTGLCIVFGLLLIYSAFGGEDQIINHKSEIINCLVFIGLGLFAMIGAVTYTLGKHSYGYLGLGDLGVMIFFGLLSTMGGYYLQTRTMSWEVFWSGLAIGMPCVGVLNLNNIRDMQHDIEHGKHTFASRLGQTGARVYHTMLLVGCLVIFSLYGHGWVWCVTPVWAWHLWFVWSKREKLDRQMPVLMFSTLLVTFLALIS